MVCEDRSSDKDSSTTKLMAFEQALVAAAANAHRLSACEPLRSGVACPEDVAGGGLMR